ncbi:MAG: RdgB/HAM1 family non-canonical purine NTP pyrophosphatase [Candidatus Omnitrophica bacterium]|nr:RdgB/HAM1 family non-canonical purine NTP pyrophosphatase [Candidatus Omnitrophota bacterium]
MNSASKKILVLGTKNKDKLRELKRLLKGAKLRALSPADFPGCPEAAETGRTFEANAKQKARAYSKFTGSLALADDSGLRVDALGGRPGVYSARFAGPGCTYEDNNRKLLRLLQKTPPSKRGAKFVCVVALYDAGKLVGVVRGECRGRIAQAPRGRNGFGYDPVFIPDGFSKTFAELPKTQKNKISHRGRAMRAARRLLLHSGFV